MTTPRDVLEFWFAPQARRFWFERNRDFDERIRSRFSEIVHAAQQGELDHWRQSPDGMLALLLLLDQFSRIIYHNTAKAFLGDERARRLADEAIAKDFDQQVGFQRQHFFYSPFQHSENLSDQVRAIQLLTAAVDRAASEERENAIERLERASQHRFVIERFGRFPHRNEALGRPSTEAEIAFLREPNRRF